MISSDEHQEPAEEQQELPVEQEAYQDSPYNHELSLDEDLDFALEVSIDKEDEYQPTYQAQSRRARSRKQGETATDEEITGEIGLLLFLFFDLNFVMASMRSI